MISEPLSAKGRLRRSKSARSFRKSHPPSVPREPFDPDLAKHHATAAASLAMLRCSERSSTESRSSYDRLGGPNSVAVPQRRRRSSSIQFTEDSQPVSYASVANESSARQSESSVGIHEPYESPTAALSPINEFGGLDGRNSELPSSYRRLRKAKSMFSTRHRLSHLSYGMSSPRDRTDSVMPETPRPERTLRRSMSFLRGGHPSRAVRHAKSQDVSIQLARAQFLQNGEPQGRQSSLLAPKTRREHRPFRKTFRTTSAPVADVMGTSSWADQPRAQRFHGKARTISKTIKRGIKRVLGLSRLPGEPTPVPPSPTALSLYGHDNQFTESAVDPDYTPEGNHLCYRTGLGDDILSRSPTVIRKRSSDSVATSKSRVTSWADSTANTIALRKAADTNSLSIIDEYEDINRTPQQTLDSFSHELMPHASPLNGKSSAARQNKSVDSQRLYSALMKRIGRGNMQVPEEGIAFGAVKEHRLVPERTSSAYSRRSRRTVRQIGSNESIISPRSYATAYCDVPTPTRQSQRRSRHLLPTIASEHSQDGKPGDFRDDTGIDATGHISSGGSGSAMVSKPEDQEYEPYSPSIYSRTTNTPVKKDCMLSSGPSVEEPGMVTILSSQRTAYSSPRRAAGSRSPGVPIQPSSDWQKWMSSEVERLESPRPVRGHVRQNAEALDDDDFRSRLPFIIPTKYSSNPVTEAQPDTGFQDSSDSWMMSKIPPQSNFSRPFSRSSSVRTIVPQHKGLENNTIQPPTPVFPTPVPATCSGSPNFSIPIPFESNIALSPTGPRSCSRLQAPESPTPKRNAGEAQQRRAATEQYRRYPIRRAPVPQDAKAQARPLRGNREQRNPTNENIRNEDGRSDMIDQRKLQDIHSTISSKRMVEMFLDSRRRQMGTEASDASSGAFL